MNEKKITLSLAQVGAFMLVMINVLLIGPGSWLLNNVWLEARQFQKETEENNENLIRELADLHIKISSGYVTKQTFSDYQEQIAESIRYIDSKLP